MAMGVSVAAWQARSEPYWLIGYTFAAAVMLFSYSTALIDRKFTMDDMAYYPPPPGVHVSRHHHYNNQSLSAPPPPIAVTPAPAPGLIVVEPPNHLLPSYQPPPLNPYTQSLSSSLSSHDEVRTLFVAGLPDDVKPREIYNLFREFPGYESSNLRSGGGGGRKSTPFAFAVFSDQQSAVGAMHALNGTVFDLEKGSTLHINLAKANSRSKRSRADSEGLDSEKRFRGSPALSSNYEPGFGSFHIPGMSNSTYNMIGYPSAQSTVNDTASARLSAVSSTRSSQNNPPCPTIFVANLGPTCTEQELTQVFSSCEGFVKLKMQNTYGSPVAFVDFQDTASSTAALNQLQGAILYSSPGSEGMRLEYAKSRMGMRKRSK